MVTNLFKLVKYENVRILIWYVCKKRDGVDRTCNREEELAFFAFKTGEEAVASQTYQPQMS